MALTRLETITCFIYYIVIIVTAENNDADYDFDFDEKFVIKYDKNTDTEINGPEPEGFYFASKIKNVKNDVYYDHQNQLLKQEKSLKNQYKWYKPPEKVYRYTKHRIPGYDYEELDYISAKNVQRCDEKSVWTHCLCQFTCFQPDITDCFTPCQSGCECKEDYVFDEESQLCVIPSNCPNKNIV
ncbi:uncharacterized protein [Prorops nasuta]|uniref:uncharacterized protein n=1 Tax=Prorops nasuta TaxID=863751 RepID=UPI0034CFA89F